MGSTRCCARPLPVAMSFHLPRALADDGLRHRDFHAIFQFLSRQPGVLLHDGQPLRGRWAVLPKPAAFTSAMSVCPSGEHRSRLCRRRRKLRGWLTNTTCTSSLSPSASGKSRIGRPDRQRHYRLRRLPSMEEQLSRSGFAASEFAFLSVPEPTSTFLILNGIAVLRSADNRIEIVRCP